MNEEIKQKILEFAKILSEEDFEITIRYGKSEKKRGNLVFVEDGWEKDVLFEELENDLTENYSRIENLYFGRGHASIGRIKSLKISDLDKEIKINEYAIILKLILKEEE